jgi:broad specificity phosphatase PhoE
MRQLILVRHALPEISRDVPAAHWPLSQAGAASAAQLARRVPHEGVAHVFTSIEPKASGTARALAAAWGVDVEEVPGLHEHERPEAQWMARDAFEARVRELFARPSDRVFGAESADEARRRFTAALMRIILRAPGDVVAVSHGTVMTLFVAEAAGLEPFAFWKSLGMPCAVRLTLPELALAGVTS